MRGDVTGGSFPLAGDLTLTRMGFGAMQLAAGCVGAAPRPRRRDPRAAYRRGAGPDAHRHGRLLRPGHRQRPHPRGAASLPGRPAHRHQGRLPPGPRPVLAPGFFPRGSHRLGAREPPAPGRSMRWTWSISGPARPAGRPGPGPVAEPFGVLAELQSQGLIRYLGLSNVTVGQLAEAQHVARVVCVQNQYNLAHRADDPLLDRCAEEGIAFVPFFPLGGFSPLQAGRARRRRGPARPLAAAGRSRLAAAPIPEHPAHPGHVLVRAPTGQRQRRHRAPARRMPSPPSTPSPAGRCGDDGARTAGCPRRRGRAEREPLRGGVRGERRAPRLGGGR